MAILFNQNSPKQVSVLAIYPSSHHRSGVGLSPLLEEYIKAGNRSVSPPSRRKFLVVPDVTHALVFLAFGRSFNLSDGCLAVHHCLMLFL